MRKLNHEQFLERLSSIDPSIEILGTYAGRNAPITVRCSKCGHEWAPSANTVIAGHGCPVCKGSAQISEDDFKRKLVAKRDDVVLKGTYTKATVPTEFEFKECGHTNYITPSKILSGRGCAICSNARRGAAQRLTLSIFQGKMMEIDENLQLTDESTYVNEDTPVKIHCRACGSTFGISYRALSKSKGCPNCHQTQTSYWEQFILHAFRLAFWQETVLSRDRQAIGMELDIFVPAIGIAVEPGSWNFHKDSVIRDNDKRLKCREKGIRLLTVYDHCPLSQAPFEDCIVYPNSLSSSINLPDLKDVVVELLSKLGRVYEFSENDWEIVDKLAQSGSRRKRTEEFIQELSILNPDIEFMDKFSRYQDKKRFRCRKCKYEWETTPSAVKSGNGCPNCAGNARITEGQFLERLHKLNGNRISMIGKYVGYGKATDFQCNECGHKWSDTPSVMIDKRKGCPDCKGRKKRTRGDLIQEVSEVSPNLSIIGEFVNMKTPIEVECCECGHSWKTLPKSLVRGYGCKNCKAKASGQLKRKKVLCVETGTIYDGIVSAAEDNKVSSGAIVNACGRSDRTSAGKHWKYVS